MTTQNAGVPAIPPALPKLTDTQIRQENADAAAASGYTAPEQISVSDNLNPPPLPDVVTPQMKDKIKSGQQQIADDREDFMADIAKKRREFESSQADGQPEDAYGVDIVEEVNDNQPQEQETQAAQEVQTSQDGLVQVADNQPRFFTDADGQRKVELLVNGQLMVVDESRVLAAAQKLEAGDERLREAAFQRQQLNADRAQFERDRAAQQIQQPSINADADQNLRQQLRDGFDRMYNNGDDSALDGLVDTIMAGRQNAPAIDPRQIAADVSADLNQKAWDNALNKDVAAYESDPAFKDVTGNQVLAQRAVAYAKDYMMQHPEVRTNGTTPRQVMDHCAQVIRNEAAEYARAFNVQPAPQPQVDTSGQTRAAAADLRKTQAGNTVVSGQAQRQETSQRQTVPDGGRSPTSADAKLAAFAGLQADRTQSVVRR